MSGEGFLERWSRRKARVVEPRAAADVPAPVVMPAVTASPDPMAPEAALFTAPASAAPPPPTMADVALLTPASDYARFVLPGVGRDVKNAALKTLFRDPRFNVMDGLDTYIDDYGKPDPIPESMLRAMHQSASLRLFDNDEDDARLAAPPDGHAATPDGSASEAVAQSPLALPEPSPVAPPDLAAGTASFHDDTDLRLQQDDAARRPRPGQGVVGGDSPA